MVPLWYLVYTPGTSGQAALTVCVLARLGWAFIGTDVGVTALPQASMPTIYKQTYTL